MAHIEFTIPVTTPLQNKWQRMHWAKRRRVTTEMAWQVRAALGKWNRPPIQRCIVSITRYSSGMPDWDGLYGGLKPLLDALVRNTRTNPHGLGIIEDDNTTVISQLIATPAKSRRKDQRTVVEIIPFDVEQ